MNCPNIRFKNEFGNDFSRWEKSCLGDRFKFSSGKGLSKNDVSESGKRLCLLYGELFSKSAVVSDDEFSLTNVYFKNEKLSDGGEVLIPNSDVTPTGLATASCILKKGVILGGGVNILTPNKTTDGIFVAYMLRRFPQKMLRIVTGTTVRHLHNSELAKLEYLFPCLEEQQKIASFFSTLDQKIEINERRLKLLEKQKRSLLEKVFNQEFQLSNCKLHKPWTVKRLGRLATIKDSARVPKCDWTNRGVPYIRAKDFNDEFKSVELYLSYEKYDEYKLKTGAPTAGDLIFVTGGNIGLSYYKSDATPVYVQGGAVLTVKTSDSDDLQGHFLHYYFQTNKARKYIQNTSVGGTIKHFTVSPSSAMPVPVPSIEEQNKIADFFALIDQRINLQCNRIALLTKLKSAFMQQMFV